MDCVVSESIGFNRAPPTVMHVDLNSCFASVEQQANPALRGRPVAVAAYRTDNGCILAASREAKTLGVGTGMRVGEGKRLAPGLVVLSPDPWKYRYINRKLLALLRQYTADVEVKSIDEMVLSLAGSPQLDMRTRNGERVADAMRTIGADIKRRIREEIGEWLTVSVGIAPNRFLAKTGSNLHKPDGLDVIDAGNVEAVFSAMKATDLTGIKEGYGSRLARYGITTAIGMYRAPISVLKAAFASVVGYHWWLRLHGWEADDRDFGRKSYGNSYALYVPYRPGERPLEQILCQLAEKTGRRMRLAGFRAGGVEASCVFRDWTYWHGHELTPSGTYAGGDLFAVARRVIAKAPKRPVRILAIRAMRLTRDLYAQQTLDEGESRKRRVTAALDAIGDRWGPGLVVPATLLGSPQTVKDRIAFGGVKELEEFAFSDDVAYESEPT